MTLESNAFMFHGFVKACERLWKCLECSPGHPDMVQSILFWGFWAGLPRRGKTRGGIRIVDGKSFGHFSLSNNEERDFAKAVSHSIFDVDFGFQVPDMNLKAY